MDWLQKILANAVYGDDGKLDVEATMKKINEEASKHIIPKEQYNGKVKELDAANKTIGELKKGNADNETLQKAIKDHEATIKQLKADGTCIFEVCSREEVNCGIILFKQRKGKTGFHKASVCSQRYIRVVGL